MYQASVPVFRHYLSRVSDIVAVAGPDALDARIADSFPARQQFATAAGFALRIACPLAGREVPDLPQALGPRLAVARKFDTRGGRSLMIRPAAWTRLASTSSALKSRFGWKDSVIGL